MADSDSDDPLISTLVAERYRIIRRLGEGGMGFVYLARHEAIERQIALKVLKPEYSAKEDIVTRFQQEAISASRIQHPNVLDVFDFGMLDNGCAFLAMEFLHGSDLADELIRLGVIDTRRALRLMLQIIRALAAAHQAGVVHRDMKPDNVFLVRTPDDEEIVKILDFGIALLRNPKQEAESSPKPRRRLTKTGMIFGTPEYMAPEQAAGREADHRVDIYACGIILFEMLTGAVPFTGDSFMAVLAAHLNDPPPSMMVYRPDLDVSQALHDVVAKTLEKDPRLRYQTMGELASAILATPEGARWHGASGAASGAVLGGRDSSPSSKPGSPTSAQFRPSSMSDTDRPPTPGPAPTAGTVGAESSHDLDAGTGARHVGVARRRGLGVALGGLVAVFAAIGGVGYYWVPGNTEAPSPRLEPAAAHPNAHPSVVDAEQGLQGGAPTAAPRPVVHPTAAATMVTLQVKTVPAGAVISRDGFQVCDSTPCTLEVDKGAAITLDAASGRAKGSAKVLATGDQAVSIQLVVPKAVRKAPVKKKKDDRLCEAPGPGGLKIFRPCRELGQ